MGDAIGDVMQDAVGDFLDGGSHGVNGIDGAQDGGPTLVTLAVTDTHGFEIGNRNEVLPDLFGQTALVEFLPQDGVCFPQGMQAVPGDGAQAAAISPTYSWPMVIGGLICSTAQEYQL